MKEPKEPKKLKHHLIDKWEEDGVPCYYARFHQPVAPCENKEPVAELRTTGKTDKYIVDSITWTPHGLIWRKEGEKDITPLANIVYARSSPSKNNHIEDKNN